MWPQALCNCRRSSPRSCWRVWSGMSWGVGRRTEVTVGNSHRCARSTATKLEAACRPTLTATMRTCWPGRVVARVRQPASHHGTRLEQVHAGPRGGHACPLWCHRLFSKRAVLEAPYVTVGGWCGSSIRDGGGGASDRRHAGRRHPANYRTSTPRVLASTGSLRVRLIVRVARAPRWTWRTSHSARLRLSGHSS